MQKKTLGIVSALVAVGGGLLWLLSHCNHKFSSPFSNMPWRRKQTYVVCVKCGAEFEYDLELMEPGARLPNSVDYMPKHVVS